MAAAVPPDPALRPVGIGTRASTRFTAGGATAPLLIPGYRGITWLLLWLLHPIGGRSRSELRVNLLPRALLKSSLQGQPNTRNRLRRSRCGIPNARTHAIEALTPYGHPACSRISKPLPTVPASCSGSAPALHQASSNHLATARLNARAGRDR